jgi:hypothetical protein
MKTPKWYKNSFPKISKQSAIEIAREYIFPHSSRVELANLGKDSLRIWNKTQEPCWIVYAPWLDGKDDLILRSSRVLLISKSSGKILYDGDAGDEG